jgi:hypothetical protein
VVIDECAAAVEFDGTIAVVHLQMESLRAVLARGGFREVQQPCANSLPSVRRFDEQFIDPGALAAIFQAEVETNDQVGEGSVILANQVNKATARIGKEFGKIFSYPGFVEWLSPWIIVLHVAHQEEQGVNVGKSGAKNRKWHEKWQPFGIAMDANPF